MHKNETEQNKNDDAFSSNRTSSHAFPLRPRKAPRDDRRSEVVSSSSRLLGGFGRLGFGDLKTSRRERKPIGFRYCF